MASYSSTTTQSESEDESSGYICDWEDSETQSVISDTDNTEENPESEDFQCSSDQDICEINSILRLRRATKDYRVPDSESGKEKKLKIAAVTALAGNSKSSIAQKPKLCLNPRRSRSGRRRFISPADQQKTLLEYLSGKRDIERKQRLRKRHREFQILLLKRAILKRQMRYRMLKLQYEYYLNLQKRRKRLLIVRGCIRYIMLMFSLILGIGVFFELLPLIFSIPKVFFRFVSSSRGQSTTCNT